MEVKVGDFVDSLSFRGEMKALFFLLDGDTNASTYHRVLQYFPVLRARGIEPLARIAFDDGWESLEDLPPFKTEVQVDATRKIITKNDSPDISFDRSINPYRGCEHGCVYCFARPTHAYLGFSPGLDFETKIVFKPDVAKLLERELSKPGYVPRTMGLGR